MRIWGFRLETFYGSKFELTRLVVFYLSLNVKLTEGSSPTLHKTPKTVLKDCNKLNAIRKTALPEVTHTAVTHTRTVITEYVLVSLRGTEGTLGQCLACSWHPFVQNAQISLNRKYQTAVS